MSTRPAPTFGCIDEARASVASRRGAWIDRTVKTIQAHNKSQAAPENRGRCEHCGGSSGIIWEAPKMDLGAFLRARFP